MKKLFVTSLTVLLLTQGFVLAQEAPKPRAMPRTPVNRQALPEHKPAVAPSSTIQGQMTVIDTEKLHINDIDVRLFGVVLPQLSASFGPQARAALDAMVNGQNVTCLVRDRDQAGRYLATCRTPNISDMAMELLRHGFAVTARGSLSSSDLGIAYMSAEQSAQGQKAGLWSGVPAPVTLAQPVKPDVSVVLPTPLSSTVEKPAKVEKPEAKTIPDEVQAKVSSMTKAETITAPPVDDTLALPVTEPNFFMRYQLLITGLIMLVTALSIMSVISRQRRQEKRDEMKAIAAALRGELMAARAVCQARLKMIPTEAEDKAMVWPRIRATLYQAYVGRLGWLGAELARQVASIYGQASDYAAYYADDETRAETTPKRQALLTLCQHIEEVLPRLASIEQTGHLSSMHQPHSVYTSNAAINNPVVATETQPAVVTESAPLWDTMRKFARERFVDPKAEQSDEQDYASIIEEEMAGLSFNEGEDEGEKLPENVTKIRTGS